MQLIKINLNELRFHSRVGVSEQERKVGNEYIVSVSVAYDASFFKEEDLSTTVSYADIYELIAEEMQKERMLLETTAINISNRISDHWIIVREIKVSIVKSVPPISGIIGDCGVEYFWKKC